MNTLLKKFFKKKISTFAILATISLSFAAPTAFAQKRVAPDNSGGEIIFGYGLKEDSNQGRAARVFAQEVRNLSKGKLRVNTIGDTKMGSDPQMQDKLIKGTQQLMVGSTSPLVSMVGEMAIWDAPFLFSNPQEADYLLDGPIGQKIMAKLEKHGLVGLVYWENGFRNLTNNKRPIDTLEDFKDLKLRVMQNDTFIQSFKTLGANAKPMPFAQLDNALRTGAVDGQENPFNTILSSKFYESQKYLTLTNHVYSPWIVMASKKWWDTLSAPQQEIFIKAAKVSRDYERRDSREEAGRALEQLHEKGMLINKPTQAELNKMRTRLNRIYAQDIGKKTGLDLILQVQNELVNYRLNNK